MTTRRRRWATGAVITVGFLQMTGWLVGSEALSGLGFITAASPLPLVFTTFRGIEPFSSTFQLELVGDDSRTQDIEITPAVYEALEGPYNLRNVYGAVFAGAAKLDAPKERALVQAVMRFGFCEPGTVAKDFGITYDVARVVSRQTSRARGIDGTWSTEVACRP